jgi:hypothetical protein
VQIARSISLDPLDFRPPLIDWMMSAGDSAARLSVGAKQALWRLLALDYQGNSDAIINPDVLDLDGCRLPMLQTPITPIYGIGDSANRNGYAICTALDSAVSERLMNVVGGDLSWENTI